MPPSILKFHFLPCAFMPQGFLLPFLYPGPFLILDLIAEMVQLTCILKHYNLYSLDSISFWFF